MNLPDISTLLDLRLYLSVSILILILIRMAALFLSRHNGIIKTMAWENLIIAAYVGVVVYISLVDIVPLPDIRQRMLATWDVIHLIWFFVIIWSFWRFIKGD